MELGDVSLSHFYGVIVLESECIFHEITKFYILLGVKYLKC